jgi:hypothetical protein
MALFDPRNVQVAPLSLALHMHDIFPGGRNMAVPTHSLLVKVKRGEVVGVHLAHQDGHVYMPVDDGRPSVSLTALHTRRHLWQRKAVAGRKQ